MDLRKRVIEVLLYPGDVELAIVHRNFPILQRLVAEHNIRFDSRYWTGGHDGTLPESEVPFIFWLYSHFIHNERWRELAIKCEESEPAHLCLCDNLIITSGGLCSPSSAAERLIRNFVEAHPALRA